MVLFMCGEFSFSVNSLRTWSYSKEWDGYGIWGQNYVTLFLGSETSAGLHSRNVIFNEKSCRANLPHVD